MPVNPTPAKRPEPGKGPDFEHSLGRLEEIVRSLENANLPLDDAMKLFEEGVPSLANARSNSNRPKAKWKSS